MFEGSEVPIYPATKKNSKQGWSASDMGKRAALVNESKGISHFVLIDILEEYIDVTAQHYEDLQRTTVVSIVELNIARLNVMAQTPVSAEEFMIMLKKFSNLLHTLFTSQCPLYKYRHGTIKAFWGYFTNSRAKLSHEVKTIIIWIVLHKPP